jgi:hypothetical protein
MKRKRKEKKMMHALKSYIRLKFVLFNCRCNTLILIVFILNHFFLGKKGNKSSLMA